MSHSFDKSILDQWNHLCFLWESWPENDQETRTGMKIYHEGILSKESSVDIQNSDFKSVSNEGALILGQDSDIFVIGGGFDESQAFSGLLTQVEVWNSALSSEEILDIANCSNESTREVDKIVDWSQEDLWLQNGVNFSQIEDLASLCQQENEVLTKLAWLERANFNNFKALCDAVDGKIPEISQNAQEAQLLFASNEKLLTNLGSSVCYGQGKSFWSSVKKCDFDDSIWCNIYTPNATVQGVDGAGADNCSFVNEDGLSTELCEHEGPCGLCDLLEEDRKMFKLRGVCQSDFIKKYDYQYNIKGVEMNRPYLK